MVKWLNQMPTHSDDVLIGKYGPKNKFEKASLLDEMEYTSEKANEILKDLTPYYGTSGDAYGKIPDERFQLDIDYDKRSFKYEQDVLVSYIDQNGKRHSFVDGAKGINRDHALEAAKRAFRL